MSYTFRVVFDGVCAYVPDKPFFVNRGGYWQRRSDEPIKGKPHSGPIRSVAVLLPDLRRPGRPKLPNDPNLHFPSFREPHFPLLRFGLDDLREGTTRRIDLVYRDISQKDEQGLLLLRREQIRFSLDAENASSFTWADWAPFPPKKLPGYCTNANMPPKWWGKEPERGNPEQLESLWWLPDLQRIVECNPKATRARAEVLPSYRGPFPDELIARVECGGGRLRTFDFNRSVDGIPLRWRFAKPGDPYSPGTWNQALANSVALEFFDVRGEVKIELKRLANEVVVEELVLAPTPGASRPILEVSISNREPTSLFQQEGFSRSMLPDVDFQPFYESLSEADASQLANLPIPHPGLSFFFGIRETPCAGTSMLGQGAENG